MSTKSALFSHLEAKFLVQTSVLSARFRSLLGAILVHNSAQMSKISLRGAFGAAQRKNRAQQCTFCTFSVSFPISGGSSAQPGTLPPPQVPYHCEAALDLL